MAYVEPFLEMLQVERGASDNTLSAYRRDLKDAFAYLSQHLSAPHLDATRQDLSDYLAAVAARSLAPRTQARRVSCLRQYFGFLFAEKIRDDHPAADLASPRLAKSLPKNLTVAEMAALLQVVEKWPAAEGSRLRAMVELLYGAGLRVSELLTLPFPVQPKDLSGLLILGKGNRERLVPLHPAARRALLEYLEDRDSFLRGGAASAWLFPSRGASGHLTRQRLVQLLKEIAVTAGIEPKRVSPHVLRHAFASHLLANGVDLRSLQTLLGHQHIATTEIYTHIADRRLQNLVNEAHPLRDSGKTTP